MSNGVMPRPMTMKAMVSRQEGKRAKVAVAHVIAYRKFQSGISG
jgi:hypothetical protein